MSGSLPREVETGRSDAACYYRAPGAARNAVPDLASPRTWNAARVTAAAPPAAGRDGVAAGREAGRTKAVPGGPDLLRSAARTSTGREVGVTVPVGRGPRLLPRTG